MSLVGPILINLILLDSASPENIYLTQLNVEPAGLKLSQPQSTSLVNLLEVVNIKLEDG